MNTVLIVDDSSTQRHLMADLFQQKQYQVTLAKNGAEALKQVQLRRPDVIVLDIVMPEMNGYDVCRRIKGNPSTQDIPVVFCSTKTTDADLYWGLKLGADAYVGKPFQEQELLDTVKRLLAA